MKRRNFTDTVLMVRPANFGYNPETAENNAFQSKEGADKTTTIKTGPEGSSMNWYFDLKLPGLTFWFTKIIQSLKNRMRYFPTIGLPPTKMEP